MRKTTSTLLHKVVSISLLWTIFRPCSSVFIEVARNTTGDGITRPETTIPQGTVRGINMVTRHNRTVFGFLGIPYAKPPIGNLRFRAPVSPDPWNGTLDASTDTEPCPQFDDEGLFGGDEDCLHLNVFTSRLATNANDSLLPVMLYIIGGAYKTANNSIARFGPDFLLDKDVILVVPNFRLGILGFLSTGDEVSPGNYGLKDIVRALEWTQDSIEFFGGDRNRVTLFGGSSGASSAHILALSNLTNGLFQKLITHSGSALDYKLNLPKTVCARRALKLGAHLGCPTNTSTALVDCLRAFNPSQLVNTDSAFHLWRDHPKVIWLPTHEVDIEGALITDTPLNLTNAGKIRDIPWMNGVVRDEGHGFYLEFYDIPGEFEYYLNNIEFLLPVINGLEVTADEGAAYTNALTSYYLKDSSLNRSMLLEYVSQLSGDAVFTYPAYKGLQQQMLFAKSPQYFYSFDYRGTFSLTYLYTGGSTEYNYVAHGDEMIYLFRDHDYRYGPPHYQYTEADLKMVDTVVQLWTSFVINGPPTSQDGVVWEPYSSRDNYLRIGNGSDTSVEMEYGFIEERMRFWEEFTASSSGAYRHSLQASLISVSCLCLYFHL